MPKDRLEDKDHLKQVAAGKKGSISGSCHEKVNIKEENKGWVTGGAGGVTCPRDMPSRTATEKGGRGKANGGVRRSVVVPGVPGVVVPLRLMENVLYQVAGRRHSEGSEKGKGRGMKSGEEGEG